MATINVTWTVSLPRFANQPGVVKTKKGYADEIESVYRHADKKPVIIYVDTEGVGYPLLEMLKQMGLPAVELPTSEVCPHCSERIRYKVPRDADNYPYR